MSVPDCRRLARKGVWRRVWREVGSAQIRGSVVVVVVVLLREELVQVFVLDVGIVWLAWKIWRRRKSVNQVMDLWNGEKLSILWSSGFLILSLS